MQMRSRARLGVSFHVLLAFCCLPSLSIVTHDWRAFLLWPERHHLSPAQIRDWVLLPIALVMFMQGFVRQNLSLLLKVLFTPSIELAVHFLTIQLTRAG